MAASYPSSAKSFTPVVDGVNYPQATDVNQAYDEITAMETALVSGGVAHDLTPDSTAGVRSLGTNAKQWKLLAVASGTVGAPSVAVGDSDVGLYSSGANALDMATNGVKAIGIDSTQFIDSPTQPRCVAYATTTQALTTATLTTLALAGEDLDVGTMHDLVTNNSRVTIPTGGDGFYDVVGLVSFASNTTGLRLAQILKNGTTTLEITGVGPNNGTLTRFMVAWRGNLVAGDYVQLQARQDSGGDLNSGSATREQTNVLIVEKRW